MRRVEVAWLDSVSEGRWRSREDVLREATREAMLHRSLGYVLWEDDDMILLAGSRDESGDNVCDIMQIPRVAVLSVEDISPANSQSKEPT